MARIFPFVSLYPNNLYFVDRALGKHVLCVYLEIVQFDTVSSSLCISLEENDETNFFFHTGTFCRTVH